MFKANIKDCKLTTFLLLANLSSDKINTSKRCHHYDEHDIRSRYQCSSRSTSLLFWKIDERNRAAKKPSTANSDLERAIDLVLSMPFSWSRVFQTWWKLFWWTRKPISWYVYELSSELHHKTNEFSKSALIKTTYNLV